MADEEIPDWVYKPASAASEAEKKAFVDLGKHVANLPVMQTALERDPAWALVTDGNVSWGGVLFSVLSHFVF